MGGVCGWENNLKLKVNCWCGRWMWPRCCLGLLCQVSGCLGFESWLYSFFSFFNKQFMTYYVSDFKRILIFLKDRFTEGEGRREERGGGRETDLPRSQELLPSLPPGWQASKHLDQLLLLSQAHSQLPCPSLLLHTQKGWSLPSLRRD